MFIPSSTYRVQLHKGFTFKNLLGIVDYLDTLGVSTIYAAPILRSTAGSIHGYDVTDPHEIDSEIGTKDDLRLLAIKLRQRGMTWVQDIVPNHMAFDPANVRLMDVLERGPSSGFYNYFDIDWDHPSTLLKNKLMVPFLGDEIENCLEKQELKLQFTPQGFGISYYDTIYPVSSIAYSYLFSFRDTTGGSKLSDEWSTFIRGRAFSSDVKTWRKLKTLWVGGLSESDRQIIAEIVTEINSDVEKLKVLLAQQHYVLTFWKRTEKEINYRRFFTINQLICLRMEEENVFNEYHSFLFSLYQENLIQGFRIDHIDGLKDPAKYVRMLRNLFGSECYIIAEKILEAKEVMPSNWPLQGTSGYEFLAYVNQLFTDKRGAKQLLEFYRTLVPALPPYKQLVARNKKMILETYMNGEWDNLVQCLIGLGLQGSFDREKLKEAIGLFMIAFPIYRIYPETIPLEGNDLAIVNEAFDHARKSGTACEKELDYLQTLCTARDDNNILNFLKRVMQFTGPLTAKGVEDTTFYIYNPLISHDEVGDTPSTLGITIQEFHNRMDSRQRNSPFSLNATATHDTKRGEDVRIRLNVLSEIPDMWQRVVQEWIVTNKNFSGGSEEKKIPTINDEYFIYQSIVGGMPEDLVVSDTFINRLQEYLIKVVREAKVNSNWEIPDEAYESACSEFIGKILSSDTEFIASAVPFTKSIVKTADIYSLGQTLIKITAPGIPDIYQGCELWDLSFVDPDNRRPVDYSVRYAWLQQLIQKEKGGQSELLEYLAANRLAGMEKLFVTWKSLNFRKQHQRLFREGSYIPLNEKGNKQIALVYARNFDSEWVIIAVPFGVAGQQTAPSLELEENDGITLPEAFPNRWTNLFTGKSIVSNGYLSLREVFGTFPVALLQSGS